MQIQTGGAVATVNSDNSNSGSDNGSGDNSNTGNNNNSNSNQQDQPASQLTQTTSQLTQTTSQPTQITSQPTQTASQPTQTASQQAEPATEQPEGNNQKTTENTPALALADEGEETPEDNGAESKPVADGSSSDTNAVGSQTPETNAAENTQNGAAAKTEAANQATSGQNTGAMKNDCTGKGATEDGYWVVNRDEQSETVETLPGTKDENKGAIQQEKTDYEKEQSEEENSSEDDADTPEEEDEKASVDYSFLYDKESGHIKVTFNIAPDAEGDQVIELSKVNELLRDAGEDGFGAYLETEEGQKALNKVFEDILGWGDSTSSIKYKVNGVEYIKTFTKGVGSSVNAGKADLYYEPGCTTIYDVSLTSGSKHTYTYYNESFTVNTPDISDETGTGVTGFDGQDLPERYTQNESIELKYRRDVDSGCMEDLIDNAFAEFGERSQKKQYIDAEGNLTTTAQSVYVEAGTKVVKIGSKYYVEANGYYYGNFSSSAVEKNEDGELALKNATSCKTYAYNKKGEQVYTYAKDTHMDSFSTSSAQKAIAKYMEAHGYANYEDYVLAYYADSSRAGVKYESVNELLKNYPNAVSELMNSGNAMPNYNGSITVKIDPNTSYDNFYKNILSLKIGNMKDIDDQVESGGDEDHGHNHGQWATDSNGGETIGAYMYGKLNYQSDTDGNSEKSVNEYMVAALDAASTEDYNAWEAANTYFNELLKDGLSQNEATWRAFAMAANIDFYRAGNDYQDTAWMWYASLKLHQTDGTLDITKRDTNGNIIGDDAGESQTSFYIWKTIGDNGEALPKPQYCVYQGTTTKVTYKKDADGNDTNEVESTEEVAGFYYWKEYKAGDDADAYTVTTTNGNLKIDYLFLENMVYYLQEAVAPNGFQKDTNVYVICNGKQYTNLLKEAAKESNSGITTDAEGNVYYIANVAAGTSGTAKYLGEIKGGYTLKVEFVNPGIPSVPDVPNVPDTPRSENPDTPTTPDTPGTTTVVQTVLGAERPVETVTPVETSSTPAVLGATRGRGTGDESNMAGWGAASLAALGALAAYFARKRRSRG